MFNFVIVLNFVIEFDIIFYRVYDSRTSHVKLHDKIDIKKYKFSNDIFERNFETKFDKRAIDETQNKHAKNFRMNNSSNFLKTSKKIKNDFENHESIMNEKSIVHCSSSHQNFQNFEYAKNRKQSKNQIVFDFLNIDVTL